MKKYKLFLFVFALFIILSSLNINSASADILGCMPGDNFSRTTGQACVPRPACFDSEPKCLLMEPITGWCSTTQPFITVLSPNGGEKLVEGKLWTINWKGGPPDDMAIITLLAPNFQPDWSLKIAEVPNTGSYNWTVFSLLVL